MHTKKEEKKLKREDLMIGNDLTIFFKGFVYDQTGPFEFYAWQRDESGMTRVFCCPHDEGQGEGQRCGRWPILWIECPDAAV